MSSYWTTNDLVVNQQKREQLLDELRRLYAERAELIAAAKAAGVPESETEWAAGRPVTEAEVAMARPEWWSGPDT